MNSIGEILAVTIPISISLGVVGWKGIIEWSENQKKKDAEHIAAVVDIAIEKQWDRFKTGFKEMYAMIKSGELK